MEKVNTKYPIIYMNEKHPVFLDGLFLFSKEIQCKLIENQKIGKEINDILLEDNYGLIEISKNVAVLIISKKSNIITNKDCKKFKDKIELFICHYTSPIIIWQGYSECLMNLNPNFRIKIHGEIMKLFLEYNIGIIPSRHIKDTTLCLKSLAKRIQIIDNPPSIARNKPKRDNLQIYQQFLLEGLVNSGPKKTKILFEKFKSVFDLLEEIKKTQLLFSRNGNIKGINGKFSEIGGFNTRFITENKKMLFQRFNQ